MDWSIQEISRLAGTTSRTLRHYDDVGLLPPSRIGSNGYRYYDELALVRLQRILMLRELGLGIPAIVEVLDGQRHDGQALRIHLEWLTHERDRIDRQIASVEKTIEKLEGGEQLMAQDMFDGFDHTQYREEVTERWGAQAYADGDRWWRSMTPEEQATWQRQVAQLSADWSDAAERGIPQTARRRRHSRRGTRRGWGRSPARREAAPVAPRRRTCWGWPTCTSRTTDSRRTTAAPRARASCATRFGSTRRRCRPSVAALGDGTAAPGTQARLGPRWRRGSYENVRVGMRP